MQIFQMCICDWWREAAPLHGGQHLLASCSESFYPAAKLVVETAAETQVLITAPVTSRSCSVDSRALLPSAFSASVALTPVNEEQPSFWGEDLSHCSTNTCSVFWLKLLHYTSEQPQNLDLAHTGTQPSLRPCLYRLNYIFSLHRSYLYLVHPAVRIPKIEPVHESVHTCAFQLHDSFEATSFAALMSSVREYYSFPGYTQKITSRDLWGVCIFCLKALTANVPRLDRHLDCSGWEESWRVFVVAWACLLIPRNLGRAKHNLAVTAEIAMFGYSEKPHKCHWHELNWTGKRHARPRHPTPSAALGRIRAQPLIPQGNTSP